MNSLQVETIKLEPAKVEFNHEQIERELEENLKRYEGLTFTEESTKELRSTLAELRKGKNAVDSYRKEVKKELTQPVKDFEEKCKSLNKRFDSVIKPLKQQLDDFEEKRKQEKAEEIKEMITQIIADFKLSEKYANELVVENEMLAKSRSMKTIEDTLIFKAKHLKTEQESHEKDIKLVESNVQALNAEHGTDFNAQAYTSLLEFEDIDSVLGKLKNHVLSEVKKREEIERKKQEESQKREEKQQKIEDVTTEEFEPIEEDVSFDESEEIPFSDGLMPDPFAEGEKIISYSITASEDKHNEIKQFLSNLGVVVRTDE